MKFEEELSMFKTGIETMFPVGSLVFFTGLKNNFHYSVSIYKENPRFFKNDKEKISFKFGELIKNEPFTIIEIDTDVNYVDKPISYNLFFEYKVYFRILQFDMIGWVMCCVITTRCDSALENFNKKIIFAKEDENSVYD